MPFNLDMNLSSLCIPFNSTLLNKTKRTSASVMSREAVERMEQMRLHKISEAEVVAKKAEEKCESYLHLFRKQVVEKEDELIKQKQETSKKEQQMTGMIEELGEECKKWKAKFCVSLAVSVCVCVCV